MTTPTSDLLKRLISRGFMHQCTDLAALDALASKGTVVGYIGFDCTAPSLHVGSLLQIMMLRHMQQTGHKPLVVLGGGTTRIGDPSGKDEARQLLDDTAISANMAGIRQVFEKFLSFGDGPTDAVMINNDDWLRDINYVDFLRDYGRHFSVNRMLGFDSVKLRLEREQPLTFLEFNYMILQAYDFLELYKRHNCVLQLGGSDQWGNIVNGVDLTRRLAGAEVFGFTSPLITTSSGAKMGKTAAGAMWLNADMLSPYDYWQFWRNTDDADVGRFLRLFTDMPLADIEQIEKLDGADLNDAKKTLATLATAMAHGQAAADQAAETARKTFEEGGLSANLPSTEIPSGDLTSGMAAFDLFHLVGLAASKGEARKLIRGGGARLNDVRIEDENLLISLSDLNPDGVIKLSAGKKRHILVKPV